MSAARRRRSDRYDLVIVGGGTGGLVAAIVAAGIGARVAMVERERTGGDCLWTGCVPSKSLIAAAQLAHDMRHAERVGVAPTDPEVDFAQVMNHVHGAITTIEPHDSPERLRAAGVEVIAGDGRFLDGRTLAAGDRRLRFRSAIIATGSQPAIPPLPGLADTRGLLTTDTLWEIRTLPKRLTVLGGGPIGCELAQALQRLGSSVTIVEAADRLLLDEEPAASELIAARLAAEGVDVRVAATATAVSGAGDGPSELVIEGSGETCRVPFDSILVATGRLPRTDGLGLVEAGVATDAAGAVTVDERLRTTAPGIYAVGDVTGLLPFTHVAAHHARVAAVNALFGTRGRAQTAATIPSVTFTDPEVARVGLTSEQARERWGERAVVTEISYEAVDRAITDGRAYGFARLVGDRRRRLVGATVAAPAAGEAIGELAARIAAGDRIDAVSTAVHAYPTLAEGPARAADAMLIERYSARRYRAAARPLLAARRVFGRGPG